MSQVGVIRRPRASVARRGNEGGGGETRRGERKEASRSSRDERWPRKKEKAATRSNRKLSRPKTSFQIFPFFFLTSPRLIIFMERDQSTIRS